jgi:glutathione S-transferase
MADRRVTRHRKPVGAGAPLRPRRPSPGPERGAAPAQSDRIVLYSHPASHHGAKVAIVLAAKGIAHEERRAPGGLGSPAYRAIVRAGTIPAIVHGDLVLSDSDTIVEYLDELVARPPMLPGNPAERARQRLLARLHDLQVEPAMRGVAAQMSPQRRERAVIEERAAELHSRLELLDALAEPRPFLVTRTLGLADCGYPPTLALAEMMLEAVGLRLRLSPRLQAWRETLAAEPSVAEVMAVFRPAGEAWLEARLAGG